MMLKKSWGLNGGTKEIRKIKEEEKKEDISDSGIVWTKAKSECSWYYSGDFKGEM